ncbi:MAG: Rrf2 family transcriptional regulator [Candidatus Eisenbacteria bacterium]|uniref:Rrf2 family transcriptional regulator n=1 Tax=Eiseniibacteriota bacterium TaxID=2212470 RepID=A0A956NB46_UNCEI|nr:Rrf2 family transcriptional regulator [Candidatus Eisenbacteria bacterium]MCB9465962.1 Rrf2 family transcriptional regulator [Candidatus Eisenbacteria bacterium]
MKLTSQQEFGLRCLLRLAREELGEENGADPSTLPVNRISEDEGLSTEYAGKLMGVLARAGLVESIRGRNGGYRLARPSSEISLAESMAALGGKLFDGDTCERFRGDRNSCIHSDACTIRSVWSGLQFVLDQVLTRTSLRDMVERSEAGMAQWVQHHVSALVQSANEGNWFAPAAPSSVGASCESTSNDRATEADGADEEDRESITLSHGARGNHGEHAGNS